METEGSSEGISLGRKLETTEAAGYEADVKVQRDTWNRELANAFNW